MVEDKFKIFSRQHQIYFKTAFTVCGSRKAGIHNLTNTSKYLREGVKTSAPLLVVADLNKYSSEAHEVCVGGWINMQSHF